MLYLDLFCAPVSKRCLWILENRMRAHQGVTLSVNLDGINCFDHGECNRYYVCIKFQVRGSSKMFPYKLMVIAFCVSPFQLGKCFIGTPFFQIACTYYTVITHTSFLQHLDTISLPSVSMDLPHMEVSYNWNPSII